MRYLIYSIPILCSLLVSGQPSNLIFFTEEGENFTLYVNGDKINEAPTSRSKASGITTDFAQIKIEFETPGAPIVKSNMMVDAGKEITAIVRKNKKGKYVTRLVSVVDVPEESSTEKVRITNSPPPSTSQQPQAEPIVSNTNSSSTTITASAETPDTDGVGISISAGGETFSMNVNMSGMEQEHSSTTTNTITNTNSTSTGSQLSARVEGKRIILSDGRVYTFNYYNANRIGPVIEMKNPVGASVDISYEGVIAYSGEVPFQYNEDDWKKSKAYFKLTVNEGNTSWSVKLKHSGQIIIEGPDSQSETSTVPASNPPAATSGCSTPMAAADFDRAKESISNKSFSDEQMAVFKQVIKSNCLSVSQVTEVMGLFTYEEEKLDVAKLSYPKTVDKGNYYQVNDALTYSDSIEALEAFLEKQ